ncbi:MULTISPECIES: translation initiation factor [Aminobacterium]|jgi:translation initiation factor 1|uniref:translation initiation factor n=1 Tax=Aminobacterium TaxID=81466 RepID=UPI0025797FFC|nr:MULTISPECIES: translation initiation factor [unclassified Aminobacterium]
MARKKNNEYKLDNEPLYNNPFRSLLGESELSLEEKKHNDEVEENFLSRQDVSLGEILKGKIVLRIEKKGRSGKTVTIVETRSGTLEEKKVLARCLRRSLGCGSTVENDLIVVQGDQRDRIKKILEEKGSKNISL